MQPQQQEVNVKVAVRVRPILAKEKLGGDQICVKFVPGSNQLVVGKDRAFTFDNVLSSKSTQVDVYEQCVKGLVKSVFDGYNATVFAYGQTGSGKTYTIGGCNNASITEEEYGIIPQAIQDIFNTIQSSKDIEFTIKVSYIEIYKEELQDLLDIETSSRDLHIREDDQGNTIITGAREVCCRNMDEVLYCMEHGSAARHTGSTQMNEQSSRSHSIFTITIDQRSTSDDNKMTNGEDKDEDEFFDDSDDTDLTNAISAKFHFVDLAGSERVNRTGNVGDRFKESVHINTGLLALGNVISALGDPKKKASHIPYRDAKITRLLKDSLGGNAKTLMICCISPSVSNFDETLNSLKYANRAKNIKNKPIVNRDTKNAKLQEMQSEIKALRDELQRQRTSLLTGNNDNNLLQAVKDASQIKDLEDQIVRLQTECSHYKMITERAYKQLIDLQNRDVLSRSQGEQLRDFLDLVEEVENKVPVTLNKDLWQNDTVMQLQRELNQCQADLRSDEEIFADKNKELSHLKERLVDMEEKVKHKTELLREAEDNCNRQQQQMIEQQMKLEEIELKQKRERHVSIGEFEEINVSSPPDVNQAPHTGRRAKSAPISQGTKPLDSLSVSIAENGWPPSRNIHTSPALFSLEKVMQNFRARSQLIVNRLEDTDEVLHHGFSEDEDSSSNSNGSDEDKQAARTLGKTFKKTDTFKVLSKINPKSVTTDDEKISLRQSLSKTTAHKKFGETINKGFDDSTYDKEKSSFGPMDVSKLRSSTELQNKKIKQSQLRVQESTQKMRDLAINIRLKEQLIRNLVKTGKDAQTMNKQYEDKITQLEKEKNIAKKELMDVQRAFTELEQKEHQEVKEKQNLQIEYRKKIEQSKSKLSVLQRKQKETEKIASITGQHDKKIQELEVSITKMKHDYDQVQKRLKEENDVKAKLEREVKKEQQRIKELQIQNEQQQKILKRKNEEIAIAQRKLRGGSATTGDHSNIEEQKQWLDGEIEKVIEQRQKMEDLERELARREEIIARKEDMLNEKSTLEIKRLRSSQVLNTDLLTVQHKLENVEKTIEEKTREIASVSVEEQRQKVKEDIDQLQHTKDRLRKQRLVLDEKLYEGSLMSSDEERRLIELDEAIDALDAAIDYKNDRIRDHQLELRQSQTLTQSEDHLMGRLQSLSSNETKSLLYRYFEKVIMLRENGRKKGLECSELEMKIDEQERLLRDLDVTLQTTAMETDRRLTEQQQEYENKIQVLVHQLAQSSEGVSEDIDQTSKIHQLEKDLFYYKKTSRELKKKLRELVTAIPGASNIESSASSSVHSHSARGEGDYIRRPNSETNTRDILPKTDQSQRDSKEAPQSARHVMSIKLGPAVEELRGSPRQVVTPIKISRKDLRPMTAEEVKVRRSHAHSQSSVTDSLEEVNKR